MTLPLEFFPGLNTVEMLLFNVIQSSFSYLFFVILMYLAFILLKKSRAEIDVKKEIRRAVDTGKVLFGARNLEKNILKESGELIILSNNLPGLEKERIHHLSQVSGVPVYDFSGSAHELGEICGKPFIISAMLVTDAGKSKILSAVKKTAKK